MAQLNFYCDRAAINKALEVLKGKRIFNVDIGESDDGPDSLDIEVVSGRYKSLVLSFWGERNGLVCALHRWEYTDAERMNGEETELLLDFADRSWDCLDDEDDEDEDGESLCIGDGEGCHDCSHNGIDSCPLAN